MSQNIASLYDDNVVGFLRRDKVELYLKHISLVDTNIQFKIGKGVENSFPFLDLKIIGMQNGELQTTVGRKKIYTDK